MRLRLFVLMLSFCVVFRVDAGALPNFSGSVNKAVAQTIEKTAIRRGFAANDPRFAATYSGAATVVASVAADVAVAAATAATAPVWLSVAAGLGAAAVVGGLAYGVYKIFFDDNTSEAKFVVRSSSRTPTGNVVVPSGLYTYVQPGLKADEANHLIGSSRLRIPNESPFSFFGISVYCDLPDTCMAMGVQGWIDLGGGTGAVVDGPCSAEVNNVVTCQAKRIGSGGSQTPQSSWTSSTHTFTMVDNPYLSSNIKGKISDIVAAIPQTELDKAADPSVIATLANNVWQQAAARPDYQGLPYSVVDPVTTSDAASVQSTNPSTWPTNWELVAPVTSAASQPVPLSPTITVGSPSTTPTPTPGSNVNVVNTPNVNVTNNVKVDFGSDPGVGTPSLESTPTAQMILSPLLNLFPSLKNFVVPAHNSDCPKPSMTIFNKLIVLDGHCSLLETVRPTLYAVMAFVWAVVAMFIILAA